MCEKKDIFFRPNDYFGPNETLIVAVSGGVDSMVLLHMVSRLSNPIVVAHVNHKKRKVSDQEYTAVKKYANSLNIRFEGFVLNTKPSHNFQDFARQERLAFFKSLAEKYTTDKVLLAHHLDDQIETICMRYTHSMHPLDFSGMKEVQRLDNIFLIRPLLSIYKKRLINYSISHSIPYFEDSTNKDLRYTRNKFRHEIIPFLRHENPQFDTLVLSLNTSVKNLKERLVSQANHYLSSKDKIPVNEFLSFHPYLQETILKTYLSLYSKKQVTRKHLFSIVEQLKQPKNFVYKLSGIYAIHKEYNFFFILKDTQTKRTIIEINKPGTYLVDEQLSFVVSYDKNTHISSNYCVLWYNELVFPLYIRTRNRGDKIKLSFGSKKIKDLFIDKKLAPSMRDEVFLLTNQKEVLWIPFLKLYKYQRPKTRKIYVYEVKHVRKRY